MMTSLTMTVLVFSQQVRTFYGEPEGLPPGPAFALVATASGDVFAYGSWGCYVHRHGVDRWEMVRHGNKKGDIVPGPAGAPWDGPLPAGTKAVIDASRPVAFGSGGVAAFEDGGWKPFPNTAELGGIRDAVRLKDGSLALAAATGAFCLTSAGKITELLPRDATRAWQGWDTRAVAVGPDGDLWLALPQGIARRHGQDWTLYDGRDGVPFMDATCLALGPDGVLWMGTTFGAVSFDGSHWAYRQGRRWLPDDSVRALCIEPNGTVWFATDGGIGNIHTVPMTLARKAQFFEKEIDLRHRRTKYGYVIDGRAATPGDKTSITLADSDNDGLWTAMYGAGECFAYAATGDPAARTRAEQAWQALRFLGTVTRGGTPEAEPGFVARTVIPASAGNPNLEHYTPEKDRQKRQHDDRLWKILSPRWPLSADGQWYWKADTSSDELDGHFFFYARYYDLVAREEDEKALIRDHVCAIMDHLMRHDYCLVDHDGKPTRWAVFGPDQLNENPDWFAERGLNSLSLLSYLATAFHMSGDERYRRAADNLVQQHGYLQNLLVPKIQHGIGSGNQSDDEMAFMCFYNLIRYTHSDTVRQAAASSLRRYWELEKPEMNPLFNVIYAVCCAGQTFQTPHRNFNLAPRDSAWLEDAVETLQRFPLDRFNWAHTNSRRQDVIPLHPSHRLPGENGTRRGMRPNGKVVPVDECFFSHWNYDPWSLDSGGDGRRLADGAVYLLPYYMALYHGFINKPSAATDAPAE